MAGVLSDAVYEGFCFDEVRMGALYRGSSSVLSGYGLAKERRFISRCSLHFIFDGSHFS